MKVTAIILAAGNGSRMKSDVKKQYISIGAKPVIWYTLNSFEKSNVDDIILVTGVEEIEYCKKIIKESCFDKVSMVMPGGKERYDSVYEGLKRCENSDYVLIHDGARPLIDNNMINRVISAVVENEACILGVPVKDTVKVTDENGYIVSTPKRNVLYNAQTPQAFKTTLILEAYQKMYQEHDCSITDDAMAVELYTDKKVKVIMGDYNNVKITTCEDLDIVEKKLKKV